MFQGSVKENAPLGTPILLNMRAQDYDDPHEGTNARVTYSIEQNQVSLKPDFRSYRDRLWKFCEWESLSSS